MKEQRYKVANDEYSGTIVLIQRHLKKPHDVVGRIDFDCIDEMRGVGEELIRLADKQQPK